MRVRGLLTGVGVLLLLCASLLFKRNSAWASSITPQAGENPRTVDERIAVVVPCYDGDLKQALDSMKRCLRLARR